MITSKSITSEERKFISKYDNVIILNDVIESYDKESAFCDTLNILQHVDGVISTDTSLVHLSLTAGIKTYVLLSIGHEWRWNNTNWYPKAILLKQTQHKQWQPVISSLKLLIK